MFDAVLEQNLSRSDFDSPDLWASANDDTGVYPCEIEQHRRCFALANR